MSIENWQEQTQKAYDTLTNEIPNEENSILWASSIIILEHLDKLKLKPIITLKENESNDLYFGLNLLEEIKNELKDSEKYFQLFKRTKDRQWLQIAYEESIHLKKWIELAKEYDYDVIDFEHRNQELQDHISRS